MNIQLKLVNEYSAEILLVLKQIYINTKRYFYKCSGTSIHSLVWSELRSDNCPYISKIKHNFTLLIVRFNFNKVLELVPLSKLLWNTCLYLCWCTPVIYLWKRIRMWNTVSNYWSFFAFCFRLFLKVNIKYSLSFIKERSEPLWANSKFAYQFVYLK